MRCYLGNYFSLMILFLKKQILPRYKTRPWLTSVLQCLSAAQKNRPIFWKTEAKLKREMKKKQLYLPTIKYPLFLEEEFPPLQCVLLRPDCPCSQIKGGCQTPHYQTHKLEKSFRMPSGVPGKLLDSPVSKKQTNKTGQMGVDARL